MPNPQRVRLAPLLLIVATAALTIAAGLMLFSTFMLYDDEGYVLISLRNFAEHGGLYREVYSQYGPFPYVAYYFLHLLGIPLEHTTGRCLTLLAWSGAASLAGWAAWRVTRHSACALAVLAATFIYLWVMVSEPNHPGGIIALVTAVMGAGGFMLLMQGRWRAWSVTIGIGCAVLLLTKINIGVFATLSTLAFLALYAPGARWRVIVPWLLGAGLIALPFALMRPLLSRPWVKTFAWVFAFAAIPIAGALARASATLPLTSKNPRATPTVRDLCATPTVRDLWALFIAGVVVSAMVLGVVFARGTSPADLLEGVVWGPLHHPAHFSLRFKWPAGELTVSSISLACFLLVLAALRLGLATRVRVDTAVALLRLAAAGGMFAVLCQFPDTSPDNIVFSYALAGLWVFLWPLSGEDGVAIMARAWLGLLFLGQWLHTFPVPGSQIAWGTFLAVPLTAIGAWQAGVWLAQRYLPPLPPVRAVFFELALTLTLVAFGVTKGMRLAQIGSRYWESRPLNLPGAERLRLPDSTTALYLVLVLNATAHSDVLFSLPGMFSFNIWADVPTPTLANVTHWFSLLDEDQQQAIIAQLRSHPRAAVIVQQGLLDFLKERKLTPSGPLYDYLCGEFQSAFSVDGFQFRVHRGRHIAPFLTADVYQQKTVDPSIPNTLLKLTLLLAPDQVIAGIDVAELDSKTPPHVLTNANCRITSVSIDLAGVARGQPEARTFPFAVNGAAEVALYFNRPNRVLSTSRTYLILRSKTGAEIALVRLRP